MAISRLATPSSPVTAGGVPVRTARRKAKQLGAQRLGMADREMAHGIAAVRLEAEAFGHLARQQIAHDVFAAGGDGDVARLERRQPIGVDVREHAGGGAELQQRDVLALGDRAGKLRLHLDDFGIGEPADQVDIVHGEIDDHADIRHARRERADAGDGDRENILVRIASLIASTAGLKRSTWPTISVTPARAAASMISRPSSTVEAIGFSTMTWTPRAMQASAISWCRWVGAAMVTASTLRSSSSLDLADGLAAERAGDEIGLPAVGIGDADEFGARQPGEHARMIAAHDADADHADTQRTPRVRIYRLRHVLNEIPQPATLGPPIP